MNKFAKKISVLFTSVLLSVVLVNYLYSSSSFALEKTLFNQPFKTISYTYRDTAKDDYITKKFNYSDDLFFLNACEVQGDIAKMCIALSSSAYYYTYICEVFENPDMGFTCNEEKYSQTYTKADNLKYGDDLDYVAYTIWHKEIDGKIVYCVPIRGTPANAEWYSNFNLGDGDDHLGFTKAAYRVLADLYDEMNNDKYEPENTIILTTGHSRGAAVSNIIGAELSADKSIPINQIFSYNFATPAVSKNADTSLTNIYNYNNPGDLVALLPLKEWGYKRNGIDINIYPTQAYENNTYIQFKNITEGITCLSKDSPDDYSQLMLELIKSPEDFNSDFWQTVFRVVAFGLGGGSSRNEWYAIIGTDNYRGAIECGLVIVDSLGEYKSSLQKTPSSPNDLINNCCNSNIELYQTLIAFIEKHSSNVSNMTQKEFDTFKESYSSTIGKIEKTTGYSISSPSNFVASKMMIDGLLSKTNTFVSKATRIIGLFFNIGGLNAGTIITHAHDQAFYIACTNSLYFGYMGWINNTTDLCFSEEQLPNIYTIGASCFSGCTKLSNIIFPDNLVFIGELAFENCKSIKGEVIIPGSVKNIKYKTFAGCTSIDKLTINEGVNSIGALAFSGCSGIKELTIPCSTSYYTHDQADGINDSFNSCTSIEYIKIIGSGDMLNYNVKACPGLPWNISKEESVVVEISEGVTSIGDYTFYGCTKLKELSLPSTITYIGNYAYFGCRNMEGEFDIPDGLTYLGENAFNSCTNLTGELMIPDGLTSIYFKAFAYCTGIEKLTIPISVKSIGSQAFMNCTGIKELTIPCSTNFYHFDSGVDTINNSFASCKAIEYIKIIGTGNMPNYSKTIYPREHSGLPWDVSSAESVVVEISEGVTSIGDYTFYGCTKLKELSLPSTITYIGNYAYYGCHNMEGEFDLPDGLTYLGENAFNSCTNLTGELKIPDGISTIPIYTFAYCTGIEKISLSENIRIVGSYAFSECNGITDVYFEGDRLEWKKINIYNNNDYINNAKIHFSYYYINISESENGLVEISKDKAKVGEEISLSICPNTGYELESIQINGVLYNDSVFVMPDDDVNIIITFKKTAFKLLIDDTENGIVTIDTDTANYGDQITITAVPDEGYEVFDVRVNGEKFNDFSFVMPSQDVTVSVTFKKIDYTVTVNETSNGTATVSKTTANIGDVITVTATPAEGYTLDVIKVNGTAIENTTFTMPAQNIIVTVTFKKADYTITVSGTENGTTTVNTNIANYGDQITITATPDEGYEVFDIRVNGEKINDLSFVMPAKSVTIKVSYKKIDYTVTLSSAVNGTATVSKTIANIGDVITVTATPAEGYELDAIKVNGTAIEGATFTMSAQDVTVTVTFKEIPPAKNGWVQEDGNYYYYNNGVMVTGWTGYNGKWYYMDPETGIMITGWLDLNGTWYYLNGSGAMVTGWQGIGGKWYYFENSGAMYTGWLQSGGSWYYLSSSGDMVTGWKSIRGEWYYFDNSGIMAKGWKQIDGTYYYFKNSGAMAANEYCGGYWLGSSGQWTYQHKATWRGNSSSGWWYGDDTGWYAKSETLRIDGKDYDFNSSGYCTNP